MRSLWKILALVLAVAGTSMVASAQDVGPGDEPLRPPGEALEPGEYCLDVHNASSFMMIAQVMNAERVRANLRLEADEARRVCMKGELYPGDRVYFVIKNFLTFPIFECRTKINRAVVIQSEPLEEGTRTWAECY